LLINFQGTRFSKFTGMISRQFFIMGVAVCVMLGCKKDPSIWKIENLNGNKISVFGHGGMGEHYRYPMNSFESLMECLSLATDGTEMDVCVTKDSVLVLSHSQNLEEETSCSGQIKNKTWTELEGCKFTSPLFSKADLITAAYFFDRIEYKNNRIFTFDCKITLEDSPEYLELFATSLLRHIETHGLVSHCFIESFNSDFLKLLQGKNKDLHLFLYSPDYLTGLNVSKSLNLYGLTLDTKNISQEDIKQAHQQGLRITLFNTSTEHENLEAVAKSPDFIQTDKVEYLINALYP